MLSLPYFAEFSILLLLLYLYFTRKFDYWKNKNIPYLKPTPFFGNVFSGITMRLCLGELFCDIYRQSKAPIVGFFVLDEPCLLLRDPEVIKKVLVTDFQYFCDRNVTSNKRDDPISAHILFIMKNPEWKEIRTKITPVFTSSKIKSMSKLIEESGTELVHYLSETIKREPVVEIKEVCAKFTTDVISSTSFGINAHCFKDENSQFRNVARKLLDWDNFLQAFQMRCYFIAPRLVKLFRLKFFNPDCAKFLKETFCQIMEQRTKDGTNRNDFIDLLLQMKRSDEKFMEGDVLTSQAVQFFAAGFETTSSAMTFFLYEIATHPNIQNRLREEIEEVSKKFGGLCYDSVKEMEYLDMCFKETLRKYPPIPFLDRKCIADYKIPETDFVIEKGTPLFISSYALQYDPKYYPDPEKFMPERFSKNNKLEPFTYLPFGEGPRNCIGGRFGIVSTKFGLAHILKDFTVNVCEDTQKEIKFSPNGMVLSPTNGIMLKFEKV